MLGQFLKNQIKSVDHLPGDLQFKINQLYDGLSVRAKHSIMTLTRSNKFDLGAFYIKAISKPCNFNKIRNTGRLTSDELTEFTKKIINILDNYDEGSDQFNYIKLNNVKLTLAKRESIKLFNKLSKRTKNVIYSLLGDEKFILEEFYYEAVVRNCDFSKIRNAGKLLPMNYFISNTKFNHYLTKFIIKKSNNLLF